ncbi:MAG: hypothetical protein WKG03_20500 [Telluria sp.]
MIRNTLTTLAFAVAASLPLHGGATALPKTPWQVLENLQGSWRLATPRTDGERAFRISFRAISNGSALVETFGNPLKNTTQTVYHRDGERLIATHYCAQGNQPRLALVPTTALDALSFSFRDVTNLVDKSHSHLVKLDFKIVDRNRIERRETYTEKGMAEQSMLHLVRE